MSWGRFFATLYAVLFLALSLFAAVSFLQTYQELANLKTQASESRQRLADAERRLREQERTVRQLASDPQYVEATIRRKLGYVRPDEVIFRFRE
jgi:cell division protein DivIC